MCLPLLCGGAPPGGAPQTKPRAKPSRRVEGATTCTAKSSSYYVRNRCEGFLTVKDRRVLIQRTGLNVTHPAAEIVKETCSEEVGRQLVRYRHQQSNMYICFNKKGAVKAVDARRVDGRGTLCMFEEETVDSVDALDTATYHTLRSVHNSRWFLGISPKEQQQHTAAAGSAPSSRRPKDNHRYAAARRLVRPASDFCGSHFSSGRHGPPPAKAFFGVFDLVSDYMDGTKALGHKVNLKNTLAANTDSSSSSRRSEATLGSSSSTSLRHDRVSQSDDGRRSGEIDDDDDNEVNVAVDEQKISKAHHEALRMQHQLTSQRHRIRHAKHKRPRPSRDEKNLARRKQQLVAAQGKVTQEGSTSQR